MGAHQKEWADRLQGERHNLRAAIQRLADDGEVERALDAAAALWRFWQQRGELAEGRSTLEELLARPDAGAPTLSRARALSALGGLLYWQSDMTAAERAYVEGLAVQRTHDDRRASPGPCTTSDSCGPSLSVTRRPGLCTRTRPDLKPIGDRALTLRLQAALRPDVSHG